MVKDYSIIPITITSIYILIDYEDLESNRFQTPPRTEQDGCNRNQPQIEDSKPSMKHIWTAVARKWKFHQSERASKFQNSTVNNFYPLFPHHFPRFLQLRHPRTVSSGNVTSTGPATSTVATSEMTTWTTTTSADEGNESDGSDGSNESNASIGENRWGRDLGLSQGKVGSPEG